VLFDDWLMARRERIRAIGAWAIAVVVVFVAAACSSLPQIGGSGSGLTKDSPAAAKEAAVRKRIEARWTALIKGDVAGSYALLSPASRRALTEEQYKGRIRRSGYTAMEIESVDCAAETCKVNLFISYDLPQIKGMRTPASEAWVLDGGEYWYVWPN